jgi:hypothetical protein
MVVTPGIANDVFIGCGMELIIRHTGHYFFPEVHVFMCMTSNTKIEAHKSSDLTPKTISNSNMKGKLKF